MVQRENKFYTQLNTKQYVCFEFDLHNGSYTIVVNGILLIDKPSGWTSFDVVAKVRGQIRQIQNPKSKVQSEELTTHSSQLKTSLPKVKVGHAGTLDPLATGLLLVLVGSYCKRASEFSKLDKVYEVTMKLGVSSTTGDEEGEKTLNPEARKPNPGELQKAFEKFTGEIMQRPHVFSAIKVNGHRAYKLARAGKAVALEPRQVTVFSLQMTEYTYPEVKFTTKVSSGTYIRSLVEDIGKVLRTGAYMTQLRRIKIGNFEIEQSIGVGSLTAEHLNDRFMVA